MGVKAMFLLGEKLDGRDGHQVGRELLAKLYTQTTGEPLPEISVTSNGKPYFTDSKWHFSISHTKKHAFCALSDAPIGIDAEEADRKIDLRLADKILSPAEKARFDAAENKQQSLLQLWVLKEAAAKLSGKGLRGYPNHTDFELSDSRVRIIDGCYVAILQEEHHVI